MEAQQGGKFLILRMLFGCIQIFMEASFKQFLSIAVGHFKGKARGNPEFLPGIPKQTQRTFNEGRTAMVINDGGGACLEAVNQSRFE